MTDFQSRAERERLHLAADFALAAHGNQKYGDKPYAYHLDDVVDIVAKQPARNPYEVVTRQVIAFLHDVLEDTDTTRDELEAVFGPHVARQVWLCSDEPGDNRKTRKAATMAKLQALTPDDHDALAVKSADRLANARAAAKNRPDLLKMYRKEHPAFMDAVHRAGMSTTLWVELGELLA